MLIVLGNIVVLNRHLADRKIFQFYYLEAVKQNMHIKRCDDAHKQKKEKGYVLCQRPTRTEAMRLMKYNQKEKFIPQQEHVV